MDDGTRAFIGSWNILEATLPNGQFGYTGIVTIKRNVDVFDLDWDITAGRYFGIGLAVNAHLLVSCGEQRAGLGIALYQVQPGDEVSIHWSTPELQGAVGHGRFTSPFGSTFEGEHEVIQALPDGSVHGKWIIRLRKLGSLFEAVWHRGEAIHMMGLGFETPDGLAVGWYPDIKQLAFLDYRVDAENRNRLLASWALGGFASLGTEVMEHMDMLGYQRV
jgi:hypothetical protein